MIHIEEINKLKYIFLDGIKEPEDNSLALRIFEGLVGEPEDTEIAGTIIKDTAPVTIEKESKVYAIYFDSYVAYSIRNESFTTWDDEEEWEGKKFREYSKSHFLNYVSQSTFATDDFPGPLTHYEIVCEFHVIDIVTTVKPEIKHIK
jgi:hypothetical protein